jgi:hypothetical protein
MKLMKRSNIYQASNYNVTFDHTKIEAFSYRWWKFVGVVEGKVIFNNFRYSNSTSKHQSKVRSLLKELNIKIDIEMPIPRGLPGSWRKSYSMGDTVTDSDSTLSDLILIAEEHLCEQIGLNIIKQQERSEKAKQRRLERKLEDYLENEVHFRDYEIKPKSEFGKYNKIAVHQIVEDIESDVSNALHSFHRDGFGNIVFYIGA